MLTKSILLLSIVFSVIIAEVRCLPLKQIPIYSQQCRDIKDRSGRVVETQCYEIFKTKSKPPSWGFEHQDINNFLARDNLQAESPKKVPPTIRTSTARPTLRTTKPFAVITTATTTTKRPVITPNPANNENPDYENVFYPVLSTTAKNEVSDKEKEEEKAIIEKEYEYPEEDHNEEDNDDDDDEDDNDEDENEELKNEDNEEKDENSAEKVTKNNEYEDYDYEK